VTALDDVDAYDYAWFPTFFVAEAVFRSGDAAPVPGGASPAAGWCSGGWRPAGRSLSR